MTKQANTRELESVLEASAAHESGRAVEAIEGRDLPIGATVPIPEY